MGGLEDRAEGLQAYRVSTVRSTPAPATVMDSLEGAFHTTSLVNGTTCWVTDVAGVPGGAQYRWYAHSLETPTVAPNNAVVIPLGQNPAVAGRWLLVGGGAGLQVYEAPWTSTDDTTDTTVSIDLSALPNGTSYVYWSSARPGTPSVGMFVGGVVTKAVAAITSAPLAGQYGTDPMAGEATSGTVGTLLLAGVAFTEATPIPGVLFVLPVG